MVKLSISEFKATCLAVIERVRVTGEAVVITRRGEPVAEVVPPRLPQQPRRSFLGRLEGTAKIVGDIVRPVMTDDEFSQGSIDSWDRSQK